MRQITVLVEGYAREWSSSGWEATSTATLIETGAGNIVCDPGLNVELLEKGLAAKNLKFRDIDWVFLTHWHPITSYAVALFTKAKVVDSKGVYWAGKLDIHQGKIPGTEINIWKTPGHTLDHSVLVVPIEDETVYVVAGDNFWWAEDEEQLTDRKSLLEKKDALAVDEKALLKSRKDILAVADFIIPGHGKMFEIAGV